MLSLLCVDGANVLAKNFIAKTLNKGVNQRQILDAVCEKSKTKIPTNSITQGLSGQKLPRGKVIFGEPKDYISDIARGNGASYWVNDGKLNMIKLADAAKDEAIVQTPTTGLVGMPTQTQYGANFKLLLILLYRCGPWCKLKIARLRKRRLLQVRRRCRLMKSGSIR